MPCIKVSGGWKIRRSKGGLFPKVYTSLNTCKTRVIQMETHRKTKLHQHTPAERRAILAGRGRRKAKLHGHTAAERRRIRAEARLKGKKGKDGFTRKVDNKMPMFGETDLEKKVIRINKSKKKNTRKGEILDTIVHEEQHRIHPKMKEKNVRKRTKKMVKKMGDKTKVKMYNKFPKVAHAKAAKKLNLN